MDFHNLRFQYRRRAQTTATLPWPDAFAHLANWQAAPNIFQTFDNVYRTALHPMWGGLPLPHFVRDRFKVLEYGCGNAPMYRTWRTFFNSTPASWTLADIPAFAFHFARHTLGSDAEAAFVVIKDFNDPLATVDDQFDLIIVQTVFEHLDEPRRVAEYLLDRLKPGGFFWFDYIRTSATGLDTPTASSQRRVTLEYLADRLSIMHGTLHIDEGSLGTCVGCKRK